MENSLEELYMISSKHSNYQILPTSLKHIVNEEKLRTETRYEEERMLYIKSKINFKNKDVVDIGGNIGFFTFESIDAGATSVTYYEGNKEHALFVEEAVKKLNLETKIHVKPNYFLFDEENDNYDVAILLNVVHHLGADFGGRKELKCAKAKMVECINFMAYRSRLMVFQMGYNWCGDRTRCLFDYGTKQEMIEFMQNKCSQDWDILYIGVAEKHGDEIVYNDLNELNIERDDSLGEFLNRPIFIMRSKHI